MTFASRLRAAWATLVNGPEFKPRATGHMDIGSVGVKIVADTASLEDALERSKAIVAEYESTLGVIGDFERLADRFENETLRRECDDAKAEAARLRAAMDSHLFYRVFWGDRATPLEIVVGFPNAFPNDDRDVALQALVDLSDERRKTAVAHEHAEAGA